MSVEVIQCPQCGSPLEVTGTTEWARCSYCAAAVRITMGASGHITGILHEIKQDTDALTDALTREMEGQRSVLGVRPIPTSA